MPVPLTNPVIAIPCNAPLSTSVTFPEINVDTALPLFVNASSVIEVKLLAPNSTGASFTLVRTTPSKPIPTLLLFEGSVLYTAHESKYRPSGDVGAPG